MPNIISQIPINFFKNFNLNKKSKLAKFSLRQFQKALAIKE